MPDNNIVFKFTVDDQVTPAINRIKGQLSQLQQTTPGGAGGPPTGGGDGGGGGINMASMLERMAMRFVIMQVAVRGVEEAFKAVSAAAQSTAQVNNILGRSNEQTAETFLQLGAAAISTGSSFGEIAKRVTALREAGFGGPEAMAGAETLQRVFKATGIDLNEATARMEQYGSTAQDVLKMATAAGDEPTRQKALEAIREENLRKYYDQQRSHQQRADREALEDYKRVNEYRMEDETRVTERRMRDNRRAIEQEMADRHEAAQRAMEENHRIAREQMEDQHRAAEQAAEDQDRLMSRRTGMAAGMKGLEESVAANMFGLPMKRGGAAWAASRAPGLEEAREVLRQQMEAGLKQLQKDLGIGAGTAGQLVRAGIMSPSVLLEEARAAREEERIREGRERQAETTQQTRQQGAEQRGLTYSQRDEEKSVNRGLEQEETTTRDRIADYELNWRRRIASYELTQARDNEKARESLEDQLGAKRLDWIKMAEAEWAKLQQQAAQQAQRQPASWWDLMMFGGNLQQAVKGFSAGGGAGATGAIQTKSPETDAKLDQLIQMLRGSGGGGG